MAFFIKKIPEEEFAQSVPTETWAILKELPPIGGINAGGQPGVAVPVPRVPVSAAWPALRRRRRCGRSAGRVTCQRARGPSTPSPQRRRGPGAAPQVRLAQSPNPAGSPSVGRLGGDWFGRHQDPKSTRAKINSGGGGACSGQASRITVSQGTPIPPGWETRSLGCPDPPLGGLCRVAYPHLGAPFHTMREFSGRRHSSHAHPCQTIHRAVDPPRQQHHSRHHVLGSGIYIAFLPPTRT